MIDDTFQWEILHQSEEEERITDLPSFVLNHFDSMFRDKHPIWENTVN